jgi:hypothetical protein
MNTRRQPTSGAKARARDVETAIILRNGLIHLHGLFVDAFVTTPGPRNTREALRLIWSHAQSAVRTGRDLEVRVALPSGRIVTRIVGCHGAMPSTALHHHTPRRDPCWEDPVPDRQGLRGAVKAAQRARRFAGAEAAAGCLATELSADLGLHPHTVLAVELQAEYAVRANQWRRAALLYSISASARHRLGSPGDAEAASAEHAVAAWLHSLHEPSALSAGLSVAHTLAGLCPPSTELLPGVLHRLPDFTTTSRDSAHHS